MNAAVTSGRDAISLIEEEPTGRLQMALHGWLRLLGIGWLGLTLVHWALLTGVVGLEGASLRYDMVDTQTRLYLVGMATLAPVAAVGLWSTRSWGRVVWLLAIIAQVAFFAMRWPVFSGSEMLLAAHAGGLLIWLIFDRLAAYSLSKA
ncbi:DUF6163 family protein [Rhizobiaceae bacterium]|nr:DUF6163 family protein [Rhizobiaceae bacterium]